MSEPAYRPYVSNDDLDEPSRVRRTSPRPQVAEAPPPSNHDREALLLLMRLADRAAVAKSFARIAANMLQVVVVAPRLERVRKVAQAAAAAAVHVATKDAPGASRARPRHAGDDDRHDAPHSLDHEALHDDGC